MRQMAKPSTQDTERCPTGEAGGAPGSLLACPSALNLPLDASFLPPGRPKGTENTEGKMDRGTGEGTPPRNQMGRTSPRAESKAPLHAGLGSGSSPCPSTNPPREHPPCLLMYPEVMPGRAGQHQAQDKLEPVIWWLRPFLLSREDGQVTKRESHRWAGALLSSHPSRVSFFRVPSQARKVNGEAEVLFTSWVRLARKVSEELGSRDWDE